MSNDTYRTIEEVGNAAFGIRGSEFVGYARPVRSIEAAEAFLGGTAEEHEAATHVVPAYRIRVDESGGRLREYSSDDGEPGGSAGKPALNVLTRRDLENVAVGVVRYYGGTELGVGGLARAYARATKEAIDDAGVGERQPHKSVRVTVTYDDSGTVRGIIESTPAEFEAVYEEQVTFEVVVPRGDADELKDRIRSATGGRAKIE